MACDTGMAAVQAFDSWRGARRATNGTGIAGWFVWPAWLATPVTGIVAGSQKNQLVRLLLASQPVDQRVASRED